MIDTARGFLHTPLPKPSGHTKKVVAMHTQFVADCAFAHDDHLLITGSGDGTTAVWDIENANRVQESRNKNSVNIFCQKVSLFSGFSFSRCHFCH